MNIISTRKRIDDTDVVNDVTSSRQSVITCVIIRFYVMTLSTKLVTAPSYGKQIYSFKDKFELRVLRLRGAIHRMSRRTRAWCLRSF